MRETTLNFPEYVPADFVTIFRTSYRDDKKFVMIPAWLSARIRKMNQSFSALSLSQLFNNLSALTFHPFRNSRKFWTQVTHPPVKWLLKNKAIVAGDLTDWNLKSFELHSHGRLEVRTLLENANSRNASSWLSRHPSHRDSSSFRTRVTDPPVNWIHRNRIIVAGDLANRNSQTPSSKQSCLHRRKCSVLRHHSSTLIAMTSQNASYRPPKVWISPAISNSWTRVRQSRTRELNSIRDTFEPAFGCDVR